jgi:hypothetical protein
VLTSVHKRARQLCVHQGERSNSSEYSQAEGRRFEPGLALHLFFNIPDGLCRLTPGRFVWKCARSVQSWFSRGFLGAEMATCSDARLRVVAFQWPLQPMASPHCHLDEAVRSELRQIFWNHFMEGALEG